MDCYCQSDFFDQLPVRDTAAKPTDQVRGDDRFVITKSGLDEQREDVLVGH